MKTTIEYIKEAWAIYVKKENFVFFSKIMIIFLFILTSLQYLINYILPVKDWKNFQPDNSQTTYFFIILLLVIMLIGLWAKVVMYLAVIKMGDPLFDKEIEIIKLSYKKIWSFFLISFVYGLMVTLGFFLLIIPGIIIAVWYYPSIFLVLDKNLKIGEALKYSKLLSKNRFWQVLRKLFGIGTVQLIVSLSISLIPYVGNSISFFIGPLFLIPYFLLYRDLVANS